MRHTTQRVVHGVGCFGRDLERRERTTPFGKGV